MECSKNFNINIKIYNKQKKATYTLTPCPIFPTTLTLSACCKERGNWNVNGIWASKSTGISSKFCVSSSDSGGDSLFLLKNLQQESIKPASLIKFYLPHTSNTKLNNQRKLIFPIFKPMRC